MQKLFTEDETSALQEEEIRRINQRIQLEAAQAEDDAENQRAMNEHLATGKITPNPEYEAKVAKRSEGWLGAALESAERLVSRKESALDPLRRQAAQTGTEYLDPTGTIEKLGEFINNTLFFGAFDVKPEKEAYVEKPREAYKKILDKSIYDEAGTVDIQALYESNIDRAKANQIAIKSIAQRTNTEPELWRKSLVYRFGRTPDDTTAAGYIKSLAQIVDNFFLRGPSALITKGMKMANAKDYEQLLTRPKDVKLTPDEEIEKWMRAIKNGQMDSIDVNGMDIDVSPTDTVEVIQNRAYAEYMTQMMAVLENSATESVTDLAGMFIPLATPVKLMGGGLAKIARAGAKISSTGSLPTRVAKSVARGTIKGIEKTAEGVDKVFINPATIRFVSVPLLRKIAPEAAAWAEASKIAQMGDYVLTQAVAVPALAALGAPAGTEGQAFVMTAGISATMGAASLPLKAIEVINNGSKLELNKPLQKAIMRHDKFDDMARIFQRQMRTYFSMPDASDITLAVNVFNNLKKFGKELPDVLKSRLDIPLTNKQVSPQFLKEASKDPVIRSVVDDYRIARGEDFTPFGEVAHRFINRMLEENASITQRIRAEHNRGAMTDAFFTSEKNRIKFFNDGLYEMLNNPEILNDKASLTKHLVDKKSPLTKAILDYVQSFEVDNLYESELANLVQAGALKDFSLDQAMDTFNGGMLYSTNPQIAALRQLVKQSLDNDYRGRPDIASKPTVKAMIENPDLFVDLYSRLGTVSQEIDRLDNIPKQAKANLERQRESLRELRKEFVNLNAQVRQLNRVSRQLARQANKAKRTYRTQFEKADKLIPAGIKNSPEYQVISNYMKWVDAADVEISEARINALGSLVERIRAKEGKESGFITEKGSKYLLVGNSTIRDKAARDLPGHEGDSGIKPKSSVTLYFKENSADLSSVGLSDVADQAVIIAKTEQGMRATLVTKSSVDGKWGWTPSGKDIEFSTTPQLGYYPLELWHPLAPPKNYPNAVSAYKRMHAGNKIVRMIDESPASTAITQLMQDIKQYNKQRKVARTQEQTYALAYSKFLEIQDAIGNKPTKLEGFTEVLLDLITQVKDGEGRVDIEKKVDANADRVFRAIYTFLGQDPQLARILNSIPEFDMAISKAARQISEGNELGVALRKQIRSYILSDSAAKRAAIALGESRAGARAIEPIKVKMSLALDALDAANEVMQGRVETLASIRESIIANKANLRYVASRMRRARKRFNSVKYLEELKKLDSELMPIFDKALEGTTLTSAERELLYSFISGTAGQQIFIHTRPEFMVTNRKQAEAMFEALQIHSAKAIDELRLKYADTFGVEMDTLQFISMYVRPMNMYNVGGDLQTIIELALQRRQAFRGDAVLSSMMNNDMALDWLNDKLGVDIETAVVELPVFETVAFKEARMMIHEFQSELRAVDGYVSQQGDRDFALLFKKGMGLYGLPSVLVEGDGVGGVNLTQYGQLIYNVKVLGSAAEDVAQALDKNWRNNAEMVNFVKSVDYYWNVLSTPEQYRIMFDAIKVLRKWDYKRLQIVNSVVDSMNRRDGTAYEKYTYMPNRISVLLDKDISPRADFPNTQVDITGFDTLFGRHISSSEVGQLNKLENVDAQSALHPEQVFHQETAMLFQNAYTKHRMRLIDRQRMQLNDMGYLANLKVMQDILANVDTEYQLIETSWPRKLHQAIITSQMRLPVVGPVLAHGLALTRPWIGPGWMLSRFIASVIKNPINAASLTFHNPAEWRTGVRQIVAPFAILPQALGITSFLVKRFDNKMQPFLKVSRNQPWGILELTNPDVMNMAINQFDKVAALNLSMRARNVVGILAEREQNARGANKYKTYRTLSDLDSSGAIKRVIALNASVADAVSDATVQALKESTEVRMAKAAYQSAMANYEQALIGATKGLNAQATHQLLLGPLEGVRNDVSIYRIASQIVEAIKNNDSDLLYGRLAEEYGLLFRNHLVGRFDHKNIPSMFYSVVRAFPSSAQFFQAITNGGYKILNSTRRLQVPEAHKWAITMYLTSAMVQASIWQYLQEETGIEAGQFYAAPQVSTIMSTLRGQRVRTDDIHKMLVSKIDLWGIEYNIMSTAVMKFWQALAADNQAEAEKYKNEAIDAMLKLTPAGLFADFISSPYSMYVVFFKADERYREKLSQAALTSASQRDSQIELFTKLESMLTSKPWDSPIASRTWWAEADDFLNIAQEAGFSQIFTMVEQLKNLKRDRSEKFMLDDSASKPPEDEAALYQQYIELLLQKLHKAEQQRNQLVLPPTIPE